MRKIAFAIVTLLLFFVAAALAQSSHTVSLNWVDSLNPSGTTYNVYRATGLCSGTPVFSKIATGVPLGTAAAPYVDTTVIPGNYCYQVTATVMGLESAASNTVGPSVLPFAVSGLQAVVK